ncbi:MAG: alpha/beta hydrolase family protein [Pseudomonadales bacterium]
MRAGSMSAMLLGLLASGCSSLVAKVFPLEDLPAPDGPFAVGVNFFEWVDPNREELFTTDPDDRRRLVGQVWYPATPSVVGERLPYLDRPDRRLDMISYQSGLPKFMIRHMAKVKTHAILGAPLLESATPLPLVLFSHGLSGMKNQNTIQAETLASHGFVVVSVDHAYDAFLTLFEDGTEADYRSADTENRQGDDFWAFRLPQLKTRTKDLVFVLNEIERLSVTDAFWAQVSLESVGAFGHSFGGATALMAATEDARIGRCLALDGWMLPVPTDIVRSGISKPFHYLGQAAWDDPLNYKKLDRFLAASSQGTKQLVPGTKHFDYSDAPQFSDLAKRFGLSGSLPRSELRALIDDTVLDFFQGKTMDTRDPD